MTKVSGLFSGKSYKLYSLTLGVIEDTSISRMTISLISDDKTFEQVKKQLNRGVEVIKVVDYTGIGTWRKEIMFIKVSKCSSNDMEEITRIVQVFHLQVVDYKKTTALIESVQTEEHKYDLAVLFESTFANRIEIVRGGSVGVEALTLFR